MAPKRRADAVTSSPRANKRAKAPTQQIDEEAAGISAELRERRVGKTNKSEKSKGDATLTTNASKPRAGAKKAEANPNSSTKSTGEQVETAVIAKTARVRGAKAVINDKGKSKYIEEEESEEEKPEKKPKKSPDKTKSKAEATVENEPSSTKGRLTVKGKTSSKPVKDEDHPEEEKEAAKAKRAPAKRKTKEEKEAEAMPLKPRTSALRMFVGAHVSGAGGVQNSVTNAVHIGGNAFALFLKSQRKWDNPALKDEHRSEFKSLCNHHTYAADKHVLPHGSYLVNLAQAEKDKADQAYNSFLDDIKRCEALGIKLYNFHPGNTGPHPRAEAISRIAQQLNKAIKATSTVIPVLETMAGGGNAIGSTFEDLRDIISEVEDKTRVGVCIDTCHIFAAGYDIRTPAAFEETITKFDNIIGLQYLRAFHMNDSKAPLNSHRDLHQNIGLGFLGLRAFHSIMNEPRFEDLPLVLETPIGRKDEKGKSVEDKNVWANEIKLLESLIGMDAESETFRTLERELAAKGADERAKLQDQVDRKTEKDAKKATNGSKKKKGKKATGDSSGSDVSD